MGNYACTICGFSGLREPPWGKDGKSPSFEICPRCGCEFGYQDATPAAAEKYRKMWLAKQKGNAK